MSEPSEARLLLSRKEEEEEEEEEEKQKKRLTFKPLKKRAWFKVSRAYPRYYEATLHNIRQSSRRSRRIIRSGMCPENYAVRNVATWPRFATMGGLENVERGEFFQRRLTNGSLVTGSSPTYVGGKERARDVKSRENSEISTDTFGCLSSKPEFLVINSDYFHFVYICIFFLFLFRFGTFFPPFFFVLEFHETL